MSPDKILSDRKLIHEIDKVTVGVFVFFAIAATFTGLAATERLGMHNIIPQKIASGIHFGFALPVSILLLCHLLFCCYEHCVLARKHKARHKNAKQHSAFKTSKN
ncbi:hypothetical protein ACFL0V_01330 [Nanoarchaeota archaeon]